MGMHHLITIYLMVGMYLFNVWEVGAVIAFQHDIVDIGTCLTKIFAETRYGNVAAITFILTIITWGYTRVYLLPIFIW